MKFRGYLPEPSLKPFIKCFWSLSDSSIVKGGHRNPFLTEGGLELVFNFGDPFTVFNDHSVFKNREGVFAIGAMTRAQWGHTKGKCHLFGVCFQPGGAMSFGAFQPRELADGCINGEDLWGPVVRRLADCLRYKADGVQAKIDILTRFFERQFNFIPAEYRILSQAMRIIRQSNGQIPIEMLALRLKVKRRRLERIFMKMVGISPKKMSNLFRIKNVISAIADPAFEVHTTL